MKSIYGVELIRKYCGWSRFLQFNSCGWIRDFKSFWKNLTFSQKW